MGLCAGACVSYIRNGRRKVNLWEENRQGRERNESARGGGEGKRKFIYYCW